MSMFTIRASKAFVSMALACTLLGVVMLHLPGCSKNEVNDSDFDFSGDYRGNYTFYYESETSSNMINGTGTFSVKVSGKMVTVSQELEGEEMRYEFKVVKSSQNAIGCEFVRGDDGVSKSLSGRNVFSHPDGDKQYALVIKEKDIKFSVNRKLVKTDGESVKGYMTFLGTKK